MRKEKFVGYRIPPDELPEPQVIAIKNILGGMNLSLPPDLINPGESPFCKNVVINKTVMEPRCGYGKMGTLTLKDASGAASPALHLTQFWKTDGDNWLVALTESVSPLPGPSCTRPWRDPEGPRGKP